MKKILLIEDNAELADNFSILLKEKGFEVQPAYNGADGLKYSLEDKPDIVLCDIMLPDLNGYKLLAELKKVMKTEMPIFIFITAKTQRQDLRKGMVLGADDYLTKPFSFEELMEAINTQLEKRANQKNNTNKNARQYKFKKENNKQALNYSDYFFFDDKKNPGFQPVSSIVLIKSMKDYTQIILSDDKKFVMRKPMKYWENKLPQEKFLRVHRQTILNIDFIEKVEPISSKRYVLKLKSVRAQIEVSQRFSKKLKEIGRL